MSNIGGLSPDVNPPPTNSPTFSDLPNDIKIKIAKLVANNWFDRSLQNLLNTNKTWKFQIQKRLLKGRSDFVVQILSRAGWDLQNVSPLLKATLADPEIGDSIRDLQLSSCDDKESMYACLSMFPKIENLALRDVSQEVLHGILQKCPTLKRLNLKLIDTENSTLLKVLPTSLVELNCQGSTFLDDALAPLALCTSLEKLNLNSCSGITGNHFVHLPVSLIELLCHSCLLDDYSLLNLAHCQKLQKLDVSHNSRITGYRFIDLPASLLELQCNGCSLQDKALINLGHCKNLQRLMIGQIQNITGATFCYLPQSLKELTCSWQHVTHPSAMDELLSKHVTIHDHNPYIL